MIEDRNCNIRPCSLNTVNSFLSKVCKDSCENSNPTVRLSRSQNAPTALHDWHRFVSILLVHRDLTMLASTASSDDTGESVIIFSLGHRQRLAAPSSWVSWISWTSLITAKFELKDGLLSMVSSIREELTTFKHARMSTTGWHAPMKWSRSRGQLDRNRSDCRPSNDVTSDATQPIAVYLASVAWGIGEMAWEWSLSAV
jgi:hypothetical protein